MDHLGTRLGYLEVILDHLGTLLGHLDAILNHLESISDHLVAILADLGPLLAPPWAILRPNAIAGGLKGSFGANYIR